MFLYYLPAAMRTLPKDFVAARAGVFGAGAGVTFCHTEKGPDEGRGIVCAPVLGGRSAPDRVGHYSGEQVWQRTPRPWWIGFYESRRPMPETLARSEAYPGHKVTLQDGSEWLVPVGRLWNGADPFPKKLRLDPETGRWKETPLDRFARITERAGEVFADLMAAAWSEDEDGNPTVSFNVDTDLAVEALGLNYHVGAEEISALGLLTSENVGYIAQAFVDFPTWKILLDARNDAKKKATRPASGTGSGETDSCPATARPGPTSGPLAAGGE